MKWIVITSPDFISVEAAFINRLFEHGLDILHLRKPGSEVADCQRLLDGINPRWLSCMIILNFAVCILLKVYILTVGILCPQRDTAVRCLARVIVWKK